MIQHFSDTYTVPANSSRFFESQEESLIQPTGKIRLGWNADDPFLYNTVFDGSLIRYDNSYCTSVVDLDQLTQLPTAGYFSEVATFLTPESKIVEIGCGQGEFVEALRFEGWDAAGFDPVLRRQSTYLHPSYWKSETGGNADLFIMRCVLPHISKPWDFLHELAESSPGCLVLIEFQRLEWIIEQRIWYQISHDHVNLFSTRDFLNRYDVVASGNFLNSEWGWVLIDPSSFVIPVPQDCTYESGIADLLRFREAFLSRAAKEPRPILIWGGAGKGIVLGHAMKAAGALDLTVVDADPNRWFRYLEVSGLRVISPANAQKEFSSGSIVLVCNPNHLQSVKSRFGDYWEFTLPADFGYS